MAAHIGGSFAPPIGVEDFTDARGRSHNTTLERYAELAETAPPEVKSSMLELVAMCRSFLASAPQTTSTARHPSGIGMIQPLAEATVQELWDATPWRHELDAMAPLFEKIDPVAQPDLRNAAFHLLWYGYELTADRLPCTADQL